MIDFYGDKDFTSEKIFVPSRPAPAPAPANLEHGKNGKGSEMGGGWFGVSITECKKWGEEGKSDVELAEKRVTNLYANTATRAEQTADEKTRRRMMFFVLILATVCLVGTAIGVAAATASQDNNSASAAGVVGTTSGTVDATTTTNFFAHTIGSSTLSDSTFGTLVPSTAAATATNSDASSTAEPTTSALSSNLNSSSTETYSTVLSSVSFSATETNVTLTLPPSTILETVYTTGFTTVSTHLPFSTMIYVTTMSPLYFWPASTTGTAPWPSPSGNAEP